NAEFPALAARRLGWLDVPLLCGHDMNVQQPNPRGVPMCIRILLLYNTPRPQAAIRFAYLRGAEAIKTDLDYMRGAFKLLSWSWPDRAQSRARRCCSRQRGMSLRRARACCAAELSSRAPRRTRSRDSVSRH